MLREEGIEIESDFVMTEEEQLIGKEMKPNAVMLSEDEHNDKLNTVKGMATVGADPLGKEYVNTEGLKRVYKPKPKPVEKEI